MTTPFDKYKRYGPYHWDWYENKPKYKTHVDKVVSWIKEKSVLDVGAGDGLITFKLKAKGVDNDETGVALAQEKGADVMLASAYTLPFKDEEFESVFMGDTLEHLEFPLDALKEARRVLRKNLYVTGPYRRGLENFDYETADWTVKEIAKNVNGVGFKLSDEIEIVGKHSKRFSFYAKFEKT
jgi:ubiquinone/menaquinone biosynthesis C-methylase UbiE